MNGTYDLLIKGGTVVLPDASGELTQAQTDIGITNNKISAIGTMDSSQAQTTIQADHLHILPGLIDTQVHFREPGLEHKETIASGTAGAVLGGITGVFEMPNTHPPTATALDLQDKLTRAKNSAWCNYAFFIGGTPDNVNKLDELEKLPGCCGVKVFMGSSTGGLLLDDLELLDQALQSGKRRMAFHCEDEARLKERFHIANEHRGEVQYHSKWRDEESAFIATQNLVEEEEARKYKRPAHVLHVTTAQEMEYLKKNKDVVSVEATPQHLTLSAPECYERLGTLAQMNPPIRSKEHQDALWKALTDRTVDVIGSDHAPHTLEEKKRPYPTSPSGMTGVQTTIPLMLNHIHNKKLSLFDLVRLMAVNPRRLYKIKNKGVIEVGADADFTIVDLKAQEVIRNSWIASRSGWTPFDEMPVTGFPVMTIISGKVVMRDKEILGSVSGQMLEFDSSQ